MNMKQQVQRSVKVLRRSKETIPWEIVSQAQGIVFFTQIKGGFFWSGTLGSGIFMKRQSDGSWSPPVCLGMGSVGIGFQFGLQKADIIIILNDRSAVRSFEGHGQITFGGDYIITAGPIGRTIKANLQLSSGGFSGAFSYSMSQGIMIGISLEGACLVARTHDNHQYYKNKKAGTRAILNGQIEVPEKRKESIAVLHKALKIMETGGRGRFDELDPYIFKEVENNSSDSNTFEPYKAPGGSAVPPTALSDDPVDISKSGKALLQNALDGNSAPATATATATASAVAVPAASTATASAAMATAESSEKDLIDWGGILSEPVPQSGNLQGSLPQQAPAPMPNEYTNGYANGYTNEVAYPQEPEDPFAGLTTTENNFNPPPSNTTNNYPGLYQPPPPEYGTNNNDSLEWLDPANTVDTPQPVAQNVEQLPIQTGGGDYPRVSVTKDHIVDESNPAIQQHDIISASMFEEGLLIDGDLVNGLGGAYTDYVVVSLDSGKTGKVSKHVLMLSIS